MRRTRQAALAALLTGALTAAVVGTGPAASAGAPASPSPGSAAALDREAARLQADVAGQAGRLIEAQEQARAALEATQLADRQAAQADRVAAQEEGTLAAARVGVAQARGGLDGFAGALYRTGPQQQGMSYLAAALASSDPGALLHDVEVAEQVGSGKGQAYVAFRTAEAAQTEAVLRSRAARERAVALRAQARTAEQTAQRAVVAQTRLVAQRRQELARTQDAADDARQREVLLARAERIARERSGAGIPASALAGALVPRPTATCRGGDVAGFPNGTLPEAALCPLWGTAGQVLRADAAAAFNDLSRRYAGEHGVPLCVTDSYRNHAEQVAVRAAKPTLAAVPGTSNHGWGVALDLCGGAERFDSPLHRWLVDSAAEFGWFLPAWAQAGGSKPEPWHWEFAGQ